MYAKELREQLPRLAAQMREIVDTAKKENNRGLSSEEAEKFDRLEKDYSNLEATIVRAEKVEGFEKDLRQVDSHAVAATIASNSGKPEAGKDLHARAFGKFLRNGMEGLDGEERAFLSAKFVSNAGTGIQNTMSTTTGSQGGYVVPQGFSDQLEEALKFFGGILGIVEDFETETGNPLPWPTINDTANKGRIIGQNTQVANTDLSFGQVTFNSYIFSSDSVLVPLALLQDSYFNVDGLVAKMLGTRLGRLLNNKATVGTGTSEPNGIATAVLAAGNGVTGATGSTTSITYDNLVDVQHSVDPAYRNAKAKWMFHDSTLKALKHLKDSQNRPLWQPGISAGFGAGMPSTILDNEYVVNNDMPVMAASACSVLFGDLTKYKVRRVKGGTTVMRLVERYADYLQVGFIGFLRADGQLIDAGTHPVAFYQNSAT